MKNLNLSNIKNTLNKIKIIDILFIGMILVCIGLFNMYKIKSNDLKIAELNLKAQNDIVKVLKNKVGENVYVMTSLISSVKELKKTNSQLILEIDKLSKKDRKNLVEINKLNLTINLLEDSIITLNNELKDSTFNPQTGLTTYNYELKDSSKFRELKGIIKVTSTNRPSTVKTDLLVDKVYTDLVIGKTLKNDKLELFVNSSNSGLVVNNIEGSVVDLKAYNKFKPTKRFSLGLQFGYGFTIYGLSPYIGIGASYNLINF